MRLLIAIAIVTLLVGYANAYTFQGNINHTGNFTTNAKIIPKIEWKTYISGLIGSSPVVVNDKLFITNWYATWYDGQSGFYILNASNGQILWNNSSIYGASTPFVYGDKVIVGGMVCNGSYYYGYLYIINLTTKSVKGIELDDHPSYYGIASSPIVYNDYIYVLTHSNGTLWKITLDGDVVKKFTTGEKINPYTSPTAYNGKIFFAGGENRIYCVDVNLTEVWNSSVDSQIVNTPTVASINGENLLIFATENYLYAFYLNGILKDRYPLNGTISSPAVAYDRIYIGSRDGYLYCLNFTNGNFNLVWKFRANGKIDSSPAVSNGVVYFATNVKEGTIYAVDSNGKELWHYKLIPPEGKYYNIMSSPFIYNNRLYIGADSGYVYCFNSSGLIEINVTLAIGNYTEIVNGKEYLINNTTALAALHYASFDSIEFEYTLDDNWFDQYGSLLVKSIFGLENGYNGNYWMYWVNYPEEPMPSVGANQYELEEGDIVYWYYGSWTSTPENASVILKINAKVIEVRIDNFTASNGVRGGNITAWINLTTANSGWFVIVVSGLNEGGDYLAGISTFYTKAYKEICVPVLIHVHQKVNTGNYKLYAGVYRFEDYPEKILTWSHEVKSEVK